ncbi:MAG: ParB/RepB/Spo0J family partition protein [Clostridia bacterium]|nr:ParB/RepB/Spo0J family partition protein [Clostridia bacterium]
MPKKTRGLARGLDALLPEADLTTSGAGQEIAIGDIDPNPDQPRHAFAEEGISQLAQSIRDQGMLQPILVVPMNGGRYRIVAGERRWRAARMAGLDTVPCVVRELDVVQQMEIALIENLQREDLNPIEVAQGIQSLMKQCGYTQETVANRLSKSRPAVANLLRLLTLPEDVIAMVRQGTLSAGHARVLAGLESNDMKQSLARRTIAEGWSVRQLETAAALLKQDAAKLPKPEKKLRTLPAELTELESLCRETFGLRATLTGTSKKGKIVLQYYSQDELERLNEMLHQLNMQ